MVICSSPDVRGSSGSPSFKVLSPSGRYDGISEGDGKWKRQIKLNENESVLRDGNDPMRVTKK